MPAAAERHGRPAGQAGKALLPSVRKPADLDRLTSEQLVSLASEIRQHLVASVARTGGHLGPNLGVVELTIALHRTFRSPRDTIVFDTGHQAYVHKLLTGRQDFTHLRERGGLSGYPSRAESVHDVVENSHASTSLSWADGIARANHLQGHDERHVVAVIGDGAMTGGMAWEALDNIADSSDRHLVIVVNDNGRSYAPTIGGLAHHLDALRTNPGYERVLSGVKRTLLSQGAPGRAAFDALHGLKRGLKDVLVPSAFFEDLGIKYTGPVDGHDITAIEFALTRAREYAEPVIVHVITEKGRGYTPAEEHVPDRFHAVGQIHPETGLPVVAERFGWTSVFAEEIVSLARSDERIVGVTAAMQAPVGLQPLADAMPKRVIDVGIAEQHALTFSAGLAFAGMHPVVALYATFLNRAFDQVLMDVALHRAGVTIVLDRAGITGTDGASHNGMWDMALLAHVPGLRLAAPRDEATLRESLRLAVSIDDAPAVVRYPKGALPEPLTASARDRTGRGAARRRRRRTRRHPRAPSTSSTSCSRAGGRPALRGSCWWAWAPWPPRPTRPVGSLSRRSALSPWCIRTGSSRPRLPSWRPRPMPMSSSWSRTDLSTAASVPSCVTRSRATRPPTPVQGARRSSVASVFHASSSTRPPALS